MSGNVYPNPGAIIPCSVCTGNVTWRGKSVLCCTCSKWVHLKCSLLSLSKFRTLCSSHFWRCPPACNTVTFSSDSSDLYTSTVQPGSPLLMQHSCPTLAFKPLIPLLPILSFLPLFPQHRLLLLAVLLRLLLSLPTESLRIFNGMLVVLEPGALNCYIFFHPMPLILFVSRNLISTYLPLSGFLDSLLFDLIAPTPVLPSLL